MGGRTGGCQGQLKLNLGQFQPFGTALFISMQTLRSKPNDIFKCFTLLSVIITITNNTHQVGWSCLLTLVECY